MSKGPTRVTELRMGRLFLLDLLQKPSTLSGSFATMQGLERASIKSELARVERALAELEKKNVDKCDRPDCRCSCRFCKDDSGDVIPPFCCH